MEWRGLEDHIQVEIKNSIENTVIQGQDVEFTFYLPREDVDVIEYIFESRYQDYVLELKDPFNNIIFKGYIKPENLIKRFEINPPYIEITISANDGLADLSNFEFKTDSENLIIGKKNVVGSA